MFPPPHFELPSPAAAAVGEQRAPSGPNDLFQYQGGGQGKTTWGGGLRNEKAGRGVEASWAEMGGRPSSGKPLPRWHRKAGLEPPFASHRTSHPPKKKALPQNDLSSSAFLNAPHPRPSFGGGGTSAEEWRSSRSLRPPRTHTPPNTPHAITPS